MPTFKGTTNYYTYEVSDILAENLKQFYSYGLVEAGAYTNIRMNDPNTSGYSILQRSNDDRYGVGQVYECLGAGLVWESNISPIGSNDPPFQVSGVYINNTFYPTSSTVGLYSHAIDYLNGRILFNSGLTPNTNDLVQTNYSMRDVAVYLVDSHHWKTIVNQYALQYQNLGNYAPSGMASILKENRVWLPCIIIEVQNRTNTGLQLGGGELSECSVYYHIFADRAFDNKRLGDIVNNQETIVLNLYNINNVPPTYNFDGTLTGSGITFSQLNAKNSDYFWTFARIMTTQGRAVGNLTDIFRFEATQTIEVERNMGTY